MTGADRLSVSVVVPTYNRAATLPRCLDSILPELEPGDEIIVVDDGSTDATAEALARYADPVRVIRTSRARAGGARNAGIRASRGDLVAFLDSDDEWMAGRLGLYRCLFAAHPSVLFAFSEMAATTPEGAVVRRFLKNWHRDERPWDEILGPGIPYSDICALPNGWADFPVHLGNLYRPLLSGLYVCTSTFVSRRVEAGPALRFEEDLPIYEDWSCFARLSRIGDCAFLDVETAWQHGDQQVRVTDANVLETSFSRLAILDRLWGADEAFVARYGNELERERQRQHRIRGSALLQRGDAPGAREHLARAGAVPFLLKALAHAPGPVARLLFGLRRRALALLRG